MASRRLRTHSEASVAESSTESLRSRLEKQHQELCNEFEKLHICPRGARCQRAHIYERIHDDQLVKMMDFTIGVVSGHTRALNILEQKVDAVLTHLQINKDQPLERGRTQAGWEQKKQIRQMKARSKSSERYSLSHRPSGASTPIPHEEPYEQAQQMMPAVRFPQGVYAMPLNPPSHVQYQPIPPGYMPAYRYPTPPQQFDPGACQAPPTDVD
uniref:C3H1-type domain-containing protein n=1 Tax=Jimsystermes virus TaxID=2796600 RepID=A0A7T7GUX5_9MONO|nr:hypothetical protein 3 [Jimsystermes virus]